MKNRKKDENGTRTRDKLALHNLVLTEAMFELLTERGILTGEEVMERIKKLKSEADLQLRLLQ